MSDNQQIWPGTAPKRFDEKRYVDFTRRGMRICFRRQFGWRRFFMISYWRMTL